MTAVDQSKRLHESVALKELNMKLILTLRLRRIGRVKRDSLTQTLDRAVEQAASFELVPFLVSLLKDREDGR
jgi:hypothetical protein